MKSRRISVLTHKTLWGRSANRCAMCQKELIVQNPLSSCTTNIGEEHHIIPKAEDGADEYENLILLCRNCHRIVGDDNAEYTVERLKEIKKLHEKKVHDTLKGGDKIRQKEEEAYALIIDEWVARIDLENWSCWSSWLLSASGPRLLEKYDHSFREMGPWLLSRFWPRRYTELERAFMSFNHILNDLLDIFHQYSFRNPDVEGFILTEKIYNIDEWNPERYSLLAKKYDDHVDLLQDLVFELASAINLVIERVRESIFFSFRDEEGKILVIYGPMGGGMTWGTYVLEYNNQEKIGLPYPGLKEFKKIRKKRSYYFLSTDDHED